MKHRDVAEVMGSVGFRVWGAAIGAAIAVFVVLWNLLPPPLPKSMRLAGGAPGGHYAAFADRLKQQMEDQGIEVVIVGSDGSAANIRLLQENKVDVALVQSGDLSGGEKTELLSICSVFYEACLIFFRGGTDLVDINSLRGKRIAVGRVGSGTRDVVVRLLGDRGVQPDDGHGTSFVDLGGEAALEALVRGDVDVASFITSPSVPWLPRLFADHDLVLHEFRNAEALTRHYRYLTKLVIPSGLLDLRDTIPAEDVDVIATTTALVATERIHTGLVPIVIEACEEELRDGSLLAAPGTFPSPRGVDAPLHESAEYYFRKGPTFLHRWLPSRLASRITRLSIFLLPLLTLLYPLFKGAGPFYRWMVQRRVYRWYKALRKIERTLDSDAGEEARAGARRRLQRVGALIWEAYVPSRYAADLYQLRYHHEMLSRHLERLESEDPNS